MWSRISVTCMPLGVDSLSTETTSRSSAIARGMIIAAMSSDAIASACTQPVVTMTIAATMTAAEPIRSPMHLEVRAAHVDAACAAPRSAATSRRAFATRPTIATTSMSPPATSTSPGFEQPLDALDRDPHRQHDQDHAVHQRRRTPRRAGYPKVRRSFAGPRGDDARDQRDHEGRGIREHVRRIGEQRERSRQRRADDLHDHDDRGDRRARSRAAGDCRRRGCPRRVVVHDAQATTARAARGRRLRLVGNEC